MNKVTKGSPDVEEARLRQQAIGSRLRQIFDEVVNEPVPDDFLDILRRAELTPNAPERPATGRASEGDGQ
jgi:hypothetical protein